MNQELKQKWIDALRSGKYKQGTGRLKQIINGESTFCCLGVLCDVAGLEWHLRNENIYGIEMPDSRINTAGLGDSPLFEISNEEQIKLWTFNDVRGHSFAEIANYIEINL